MELPNSWKIGASLLGVFLACAIAYEFGSIQSVRSENRPLTPTIAKTVSDAPKPTQGAVIPPPASTQGTPVSVNRPDMPPGDRLPTLGASGVQEQTVHVSPDAEELAALTALVSQYNGLLQEMDNAAESFNQSRSDSISAADGRSSRLAVQSYQASLQEVQTLAVQASTLRSRIAASPIFSAHFSDGEYCEAKRLGLTDDPSLKYIEQLPN